MLLALFPQELTLKQFVVSDLAWVKPLALSWRQFQELFPVPCLGQASLSRCMAAHILTVQTQQELPLVGFTCSAEPALRSF